MDALNAGVDPQTAAVAGGTYALARVLGPSVNALGSALGDFTSYRMRNLLGIGEKVSRRLKDDDDPDLTVHPRIAKEVLDEGSWVDDDLHQEYLAGLLVGARSSDGASDAQAYLARIVTSLTADQVRLHYLTMSAYAGYWDGAGTCPFPFSRKDHFRHHAVRIEVDELAERFPRFDQTAGGLVREGIMQEYGRPLVGSGTDPTYTAMIPAPLAFDLMLEALARPGRLGRQGLLLSREKVAAIATANPHELLTLQIPDPEPPLLRTAHIFDLGA